MRNSFIRALIVAAVACLTAAAGIRVSAAQGGGSAPVLIDFRAVTEDGQPVLDLKASEVTLRVGGKQRELKSLDLVKVGGTASAAPVTASPAPAPYVTNARSSAPAGRRDVLIMIDDEAIGPGREQPLRDALAKMIGALTPADRVGLLSARPGRLNLAFTRKHDDVRAAIAKMTGAASARESSADYVCRGVMALQSIRNALNMFSADAAPTLIYVSGALPGPTDDRTVAAGASDLCQLRTRDFEEIGNAAQARHASVYVVHAIDVTTIGGSAQSQAAGLDNIAGVTGGEMIRFTGAGEAPLGRIASETSAYYLAAFTPEPGDRTGARQRVELRVARDRVRVNARPHIAMGKADAAAAGAKPVTPRDMIRVSTSFTDLPLRVAAIQARNPNGKPQVFALFEPEPGTKLNAAMIGLYDAKGSLKGQWTANNDDLAKSPVMAALLVDPGPYRMRVAATDAAGRAGTVDMDVTVDLVPAGPLKMSGLLLGVPATGAPFAPKLEFDAGDQQVVAYTEIYGVAKGANVGVTFELAESEDGPAGAGGAVPLTDGPAEDVKIARAGFGIGQLPPGDIVVRAVVTVDGKPMGRAVRTLRKRK